MQKIHKGQNSEPLDVLKWQFLDFQNYNFLISHTNMSAVIEKFWNFNTELWL